MSFGDALKSVAEKLGLGISVEKIDGAAEGGQ
jgi:hypothetical protein